MANPYLAGMSDKVATIATLYQDYMSAQRFEDAPYSLYEPVNYLINLPAKRVRPRLCLLACDLFEVNPERALPQAFAVELFHNFTLMHDDIMDEAPMRRGQPSTHSQYGLNAAVLSGDVMLIHCYPYLMSGLSEKRARQAVDLFTETAIGICQGQQLDMDFESGVVPTIDDYLAMIEGKTAILLGCSMALGGIVADRRPTTQSKLFEIGRLMGLAFQIQDDLLDVFGSSAKTGKIQGGDILQGKKTLLYLKAIEIGGPRVSAELESLYADERMDPTQKVNRVTEIFGSLGIQQYAQSLKGTYFQAAMQLLSKLSADAKAKKDLSLFFAGLLDRDH